MPESFIYWTNPLEDTFNVTVSSCIKTEEGYETIIEEPVVRPEGGGQAGDRGIIIHDKKKVQFVDTIERDGNIIILCKEPVETGLAIIHIDLNWRRASMRNHSAEHLFVSRMKKIHSGTELGYIWIDGEHGTVDIHGENISLEEIFKAEREVQQIVSEDIPFLSRIIPASELDATIRAREGVAKKHGEVRVVSFGDYDTSACSGIHVLSTGDIGLFKVVNCKFLKGRVRIEFLTGDHANREVTAVYNEVLSRKETFPFEMEQIGSILDRSKRILEERNMLIEKVGDLVKTHLHGEKIGGITFVAELMPGFEPNDLRRLLKKIPFDKEMALLLFAPGPKSNLIFAINQLNVEARLIISDIVQELGGRGGGSREVYTGGFTEVSDPQALFKQLKSKIGKKLLDL